MIAGVRDAPCVLRRRSAAVRRVAGITLCEPSQDRISEVIDRLASAVDDRLLQQEAVHLVVEVEVLNRDPSRPQTLRIGSSFIPQGGRTPR
jgi:hypothetical protein